MITLSEAFRLCNTGDESVYLQAASDLNYEEFYFWSARLRELVDMKRIKVVGIYPKFDRYGSDFCGMVFAVRGMTTKELRELSYRASMKGVKK